MGRGLSDLQRWILREARERGHLHARDICTDYFGWKPPRYYGGSYAKTFRPEDIGRDEYNRVMATISRSLSRLEARGLIETWGGPYYKGIKPTEVGREIDLEHRTGK
jgi:hypothetical protein